MNRALSCFILIAIVGFAVYAVTTSNINKNENNAACKCDSVKTVRTVFLGVGIVGALGAAWFSREAFKARKAANAANAARV